MAVQPTPRRPKRQASACSDDGHEELASASKRPSLLLKNEKSLASRQQCQAPGPTQLKLSENSRPSTASERSASQRSKGKHKPPIHKAKDSVYNFFSSSQLVRNRRELGINDPGHLESVDQIDQIEDGEAHGNIRDVSSGHNASTSRDFKDVVSVHNSRGTNLVMRDTKATVLPRFINSNKEVGDQSLIETQHAHHRSDRPWAEKHEPTRVEELAVHKKKIEDVKAWLNKALSGVDKKRLLVLHGPSGSGKTATVRVLGRSLGYQIIEWRNPVGEDYGLNEYVPLSIHFRDFLERCGKYGGLPLGLPLNFENVEGLTPVNDENAKPKIILVEEFPYTPSSSNRGLAPLRSAILEYISTNPIPLPSINNRSPITPIVPLIFLISETSSTSSTSSPDNITVNRILGHEILRHPETTVIEFNRTAPTILVKAVDRILYKEVQDLQCQRHIKENFIKELGQIGDIRNAISSLEFLCLNDSLRGSLSSKFGRKGQFSKTNRVDKDAAKTLFQRNHFLDLFHAVGKVIYNKRKKYTEFEPARDPPQVPPPHLLHCSRPLVADVDVTGLAKELSTDATTFIATLHENYILSCKSDEFVNNLNDCLDVLSDADLMSNDGGNVGRNAYSFRSDNSRRSTNVVESGKRGEIAFTLVVNGLLFSLPYPVRRDGGGVFSKRPGERDPYKMFYPSSMRLWKQQEDTNVLISQWKKEVKSSVAASSNLRLVSHNDPSHLILEQTHLTVPETQFKDLIQEILPYSYYIELGRQSSNGIYDTLSEIVTFGKWKISESLNESNFTVISTQGGVVDKKNLQIGNSGPRDSTQPLTPWEQSSEKLILSDDDIEEE